MSWFLPSIVLTIVWMLIYSAAGVMMVILLNRLRGKPIPVIGLFGSGWRCFRIGDTVWTVGKLTLGSYIQSTGPMDIEWMQNGRKHCECRDLRQHGRPLLLSNLLIFYLSPILFFFILLTLSGKTLVQVALPFGYWMELIRGNVTGEQYLAFWDQFTAGNLFMSVGLFAGLLLTLQHVYALLVHSALILSGKKAKEAILKLRMVLTILFFLAFVIFSALICMKTGGFVHILIVLLNVLVVAHLISLVGIMKLKLIGKPVLKVHHTCEERQASESV